MVIRRAVAASVLLGTLAIAGAGSARAGAALAMKTYTNKAHGYRLSYPAAWSAKPNVSGQDYYVSAPDRNALITVNAVLGTASKTEIKNQQAKVLRGLGKAQGTINYAVKSVNGVQFQVSELVTKNSRGMILDVVLLDTIQGSYLYDLEGVVVMGKSSTKQETAAVLSSLNSITLHS